ncbi:alkene reductase [Zhongshania sp.]|uniref:alkene reductase n=1 Tax=Zhongshania sp. TaxID=1971902 RepID=UPI001B760384|nr:alkene reductase [Zhongshania sp.]MBQ0796919.1 alkene reductase [Zhongshania sp.]
MSVSENTKLLSPLTLGSMQLANRVVMAPMTRSRAEVDGDMPNDLMAEYYRQRAGAGLIITEGTHPSAEGKGYCRTPGLYNDAQQEAWAKICAAVHSEGGKIVLQLMHCGRVANPANKTAADGSVARTLAPSAITAKGQIYTEQGMLDFTVPEAMSLADIECTIADYVAATRRAYAAGFDGVELHCTSGYLPAQFLSTGTNHRSDQYGGSLQNRLRFVLELVEAMAAVDGADRVGMRICPGNPFNDLADDNNQETFAALLKALDPLRLAYLHVIRMPKIQDNVALAKANFSGPLILNDSYNQDEAEATLSDPQLAAISFGRAFIANPDLVRRFQEGLPLANIDPSSLYTPGAKGYCDYPVWSELN